MSVITVRGNINKNDLGITLTHEHLFVDCSFAYRKPKKINNIKLEEEKVTLRNLHFLKSNLGFLKDNLIINEDDVIRDELLEFKLAGGRTIVEQSSIGTNTSRSHEVVKRISEDLGINIVIGTGYYIKQSLPQSIIEANKIDLIKNIVNEIRFGIENTEIKPGIIGEIGISPVIESWDKKLLKVVSKAHIETGLPLSVHIQAVPMVKGFTGDLNGIEVLKILDEEKVNLNKVIICHTDAKTNIKNIKNIIKYGAFAEFDHIGKDFYFLETDFLMDRDFDRVMALKELIDSGYINNILISQDVCLKTDLIKYGGFGYAHILNDIVPIMLKKGITKKEIRTIMVENPKTLLDVDEKYF